MSFYVKTSNFIDKFTDSGFLLERLPQVAPAYEAAEQWRESNVGKSKPGWWGRR